MYVCIIDDEEFVIGKLKQVVVDCLKEEGVEIDFEDFEKIKKFIIQRVKVYFGVFCKLLMILVVFFNIFFFGFIDIKQIKCCVSC